MDGLRAVCSSQRMCSCNWNAPRRLPNTRALVSHCLTSLPRRNTRGKMHRTVPVLARRGGLGDESVDVAVFRFTLGIPGFDDDLVPRVVGGFCAALLAGNHFLAGSVPSDAQGRTEALGYLLAAICAATPWLQQRLVALQSGRTTAGGDGALAGANRLFKILPALTDAAKQEVAWASFALLRNTNSRGVLLWRDGRALAARGELQCSANAAASTEPANALDELSQAVSAACGTSSELADVISGKTPLLYLPDPGSLRAANSYNWGFVPSGAQSLLLLNVKPYMSAGSDSTAQSDDKSEHSNSSSASAGSGESAGNSGSKSSGGVLLLLSDTPRALSKRQRLWAAALANKLAAVRVESI